MHNHATLTSLLGAILRGLLFFMVFGGFLAVIGTTERDSLAQNLLAFSYLIAAGLAAYFIPQFRQAVFKDGPKLYFNIFMTYLGAIALPIGLVFVNRWLAAWNLPLLSTLYLLLLAVIWLVFVILVMPGRNRRILFQDLGQTFGWVAPLVFLFNYIAISMLLFMGLTETFEPLLTTEDQRSTLFLYHLFKMVPGLEINQIIGWADPLTEEMRGVTRFLIVAAQIAVILPVVSAAQAYWGDLDGDSPKAAAT